MIKAEIPNALTLCNLLCGAVAIYFISSGMAATASVLLLAAAGFDFFDGFAARPLGVSGAMGKELDSLADVISFGLAPAFLAIYLAGAFSETPEWTNFLPLIMAAAAAYRLAKFNLDERQTYGFIGMPTPANALFWLSFPLMAEASPAFPWLGELFLQFTSSALAIAAVALVASWLMISELPLIALKFENYGWASNKARYTLIFGSVLLFIALRFYALPIIVILYILISIVDRSLKQKHGIHRRN